MQKPWINDVTKSRDFLILYKKRRVHEHINTTPSPSQTLRCFTPVLKGENMSPFSCKNCCCCLVVKSCPTLRDPMDQSTPGPPVFHCLPEFGQIHVGSFDGTVQLSHPLSSSSPLAFTLSQHQCLFQGVFSSHEMAKVLEPQLQDLSFQ